MALGTPSLSETVTGDPIGSRGCDLTPRRRPARLRCGRLIALWHQLSQDSLVSAALSCTAAAACVMRDFPASVVPTSVTSSLRWLRTCGPCGLPRSCGPAFLRCVPFQFSRGVAPSWMYGNRILSPVTAATTFHLLSYRSLPLCALYRSWIRT